MSTPLPTFEIEKSLISKGYTYIAGVDEVGRGPLAGPIVAAAVIFHHDQKPDIPEGYIKDSKKLAEKKREKSSKMIEREAFAIGIEAISNTFIDNKGISEANLSAFVGAVGKLGNMTDFVINDGNRKIEFSIPSQYVIKGDSLSYSVAAASIIAKVYRDRLMHELSIEFPQYGFDRNKGYGTQEHIDAIRKYGPCKYHRISFLTNII